MSKAVPPGLARVCLPTATDSADDPIERLATVEHALALSGIGYFEVDFATDEARYSDTWFAIAGWTPQEWHAVPHPWRSRCHPDDLERAEAALRAHLAGETATLEVEYRLRTQQGEWRWLQNRGAVTARNGDGEPRAMVGTTLDIDARKRAEAAMRESELRYRTVASFARGCVYEYTFDAAGRPHLQWGNDALKRVFGMTATEIASRTGWYDQIHPEDKAAADARLEQQRAGREADGRCRIVDVHGEERTLRVMARPLLDSSGTVQRVVAVAHDITDSIRMREALEQSEFRYRTVAELMPGYAHEFRVNPDGTNELVWASRGFADVYGCSVEEFNRRGGWEAFCHPDDVAASHDRERAWPTGGQTEGVARVLRLDGQIRWLRCINRPLQDPITGRTTAIVGIGHDITDLMESNAAVRHSEQRFRLAVAAMSGLVYEGDLETGEVQRWPGLEALLGYREGEIPDTMDGWYEIVHPDDRRPKET
ncbi:MAG TPA: PAS domain-containing protein, partial [Steroidobacteraceae bacterium]|nr:PAS domain-containing protein [Steroidobacteraceae bacterium]